jgi:ribosomal protein S18 acetylase RimI-like enzyme
MKLEFHNAGRLSLAEVAATATRGFEGYFVPIHLDVPALLTMMRVDSVDLSTSVVVVRDQQPVGVALVARRGWGSRLAGMAIVPPCRGQGIGAQLTDHLIQAARGRGDRQLVLECIEQNPAALRLYQAAGFQTIRRLVSYAAAQLAEERDTALEEIDPAEVSAAVGRWGMENLPWQMAPQTLALLAPPHRAFRLGPARALITDPAETTICVRTLVVDPDNRRQGFGTRLVKALAASFPGKKWRFAAMTPEEIPETFFLRLGFQRSALTQFQMARSL